MLIVSLLPEGDFDFFFFFQVKASFNNVTRCYEITSVEGIKRYHQAFINYGSHDNQRLLLEYGFIAPCNPHSVVYVDSGELQTIFLLCQAFFCQ